jgi:hypothetical protein
VPPPPRAAAGWWAARLVILHIPRKTRIIRAGVRRHKIGRWVSLTLAALAVITLLFGLRYSTGLVRSVGGLRGMWLHVAALARVPLLLWHLVTRRVPPQTHRPVPPHTGAHGGAGRGALLAIRPCTARPGCWQRTRAAHRCPAATATLYAWSPPAGAACWWVKWVDRIEVQDSPRWWQPPFPVT